MSGQFDAFIPGAGRAVGSSALPLPNAHGSSSTGSQNGARSIVSERAGSTSEADFRHVLREVLQTHERPAAASRTGEVVRLPQPAVPTPAAGLLSLQAVGSQPRVEAAMSLPRLRDGGRLPEVDADPAAAGEAAVEPAPRRSQAG